MCGLEFRLSKPSSLEKRRSARRDLNADLDTLLESRDFARVKAGVALDFELARHASEFRQESGLGRHARVFDDRDATGHFELGKPAQAEEPPVLADDELTNFREAR